MKLTYILAILLLFNSCNLSKKTQNLELDVIFFNYNRKVISSFIEDDKGNEHEECSDIVQMKVISTCKYVNQIFSIKIAERPIRRQFLNNQLCKIIIDENVLIDYMKDNKISKKHILSSNITFL